MSEEKTIVDLYEEQIAKEPVDPRNPPKPIKSPITSISAYDRVEFLGTYPCAICRFGTTKGAIVDRIACAKVGCLLAAYIRAAIAGSTKSHTLNHNWTYPHGTTVKQQFKVNGRNGTLSILMQLIDPTTGKSRWDTFGTFQVTNPMVQKFADDLHNWCSCI